MHGAVDPTRICEYWNNMYLTMPGLPVPLDLSASYHNHHTDLADSDTNKAVYLLQ